MAAAGFSRARLAGLALAAMLTLTDAAASVDLPLHHWVYDDIERLAALGAIPGAMISAKPYSRRQAARYAARALDKPAGERLGAFGFMLERLARELRPELIELGALAPREGETRPRLRSGARLQAGIGAHSLGAGEAVRAQHNSEGEYYTDGAHAELELRAWAEFGDGAALTLRPKYTSDPHALGIAPTDNSARGSVREADLKLSWRNLSVHVGRASEWWGPGSRGTLLLSDNAFPLDRIRVGSEEPFRLPGVLAGLGEWKVDTLLAVLERDREFPRARVFGLRVSYVPTDWLEAGVTRLTQYAGPAKGQSFPAVVWDAYTSHPNQSGVQQINEQAMLDLRLRVPRTPYLVPFPGGMQLYGELGSEDRWASWRPNRAAYVIGIYVPQLFANDTTDVRVEYVDTDLARRRSGVAGYWYNNAAGYSSGMRHYGFPLGHWIGTDANGLHVGFSRQLSDAIKLGLAFDRSVRERGQAVPESTREAALQLAWRISQRSELRGQYAVQRVHNPLRLVAVNPAFTETAAEGVTATHRILEVSVAAEF